ncbi:MAG: FeoB-associated Cys-rich membrane protein [Bulleidia sp.]
MIKVHPVVCYDFLQGKEFCMGTVIVLVVLGILIGLSVRTMVKDHRNGRSCSCGCDGCTGCSQGRKDHES